MPVGVLPCPSEQPRGSRHQGQLPPATYEKVITLVRDVQCRRMSLSRSEFLQHFQAICAGNPKPR